MTTTSGSTSGARATTGAQVFGADRSTLTVRRQIANVVAIIVTALFAGLASLFLLYFVFYILRLGLQFINIDFFTKVPAPEGSTGGGVAPAIVGSAIMVGIAALIGIPLGMSVGIYLSEYGRGPIAGGLRFLVDTLTGIPTIIFGLFAWILIDIPLQSYSAIAGGAALSIIMIPTVARATEEVLKLVPKELREASIALGATESRTILRVVVPSALSGIITGVMLAIARVAGETAPLLIAAGSSNFFARSLTAPIASLPVAVFNDTLSPFQTEQNEAYAGALVLLLLIVLTSLAVRWATGGFKPRGR
jgi:phosphate transport system permease protein